MVSYIPERGDIVLIDLDPQLGAEISDRRPCLIVSPRRYNEKAMLCVAIPITSRGEIIVDQIKSLSWHTRRAQKITEITKEEVDKSLLKLKALIGIE